jgi:hypothetical protein
MILSEKVLSNKKDFDGYMPALSVCMLVIAMDMSYVNFRASVSRWF